MASRLTEDQIKWILTLDASAAEKEINSLIKVNKELQEANKGVQKLEIITSVEGATNKKIARH